LRGKSKSKNQKAKLQSKNQKGKLGLFVQVGIFLARD